MLAEIVWDKQTLAVVMGCAIPIAYILMSGWYRIERLRETSALKRRMIDRGMSADEIERILSAESVEAAAPAES